MSSTLPAARAYQNAVITLTGAGASTVNSPDLDCGTYDGALVYVNITGITGTAPTLTVTVQGKDEISGNYYTMLASAALNANGMTVLRIFPGATASANATANDILPKTLRISAVIAGTTPAVTATISVILT